MTCIAAIVHPETLKGWLGGDTCATRGSVKEYVAQGKIWKKETGAGEWLFGITGNGALYQLLKYVDFPDFSMPTSREDLITTLVREWVPSLYEAAKGLGSLEVKEGASKLSGMALIVHAGKIYSLTNDFAINELSNTVMAVGSGGDFARGMLHAFDIVESALSPECRIRKTIEETAYCCSGVGGRIDVLSA